MNRPKLRLFKTIILCLITYYAPAQGCSDAGFCTIASIKPGSGISLSENRNQLKIGASLGSGDKKVSVFANYLEYSGRVSNTFGVDAKITSMSQSGNGISNFGISDAYISGNYRLNDNLKLTAGAKIPLSDGNKKKDNLALPMDYQSSLGTFDVIVGLGYTLKNVQLVLAYQQPLTQNKNQFLSESYPANSDLRQFQSTNKFNRSGDVLLRVAYPFAISEKVRLTPGLLPIFHMGNDRYTTTQGIENEIKGSQGLTLNGNIFLDYAVNSKNTLQLNVGIPFVVREVRPDGLTRSFVVNLEYGIKF
jgi:hypothetical protein